MEKKPEEIKKWQFEGKQDNDNRIKDKRAQRQRNRKEMACVWK